MTLEQKLSRIARQQLYIEYSQSLSESITVTAQQVQAALLAAYQLGYRDRCKNDEVVVLDSMG